MGIFRIPEHKLRRRYRNKLYEPDERILEAIQVVDPFIDIRWDRMTGNFAFLRYSPAFTYHVYDRVNAMTRKIHVQESVKWLDAVPVSQMGMWVVDIVPRCEIDIKTWQIRKDAEDERKREIAARKADEDWLNMYKDDADLYYEQARDEHNLGKGSWRRDSGNRRTGGKPWLEKMSSAEVAEEREIAATIKNIPGAGVYVNTESDNK